jgi:lipopolysaccharide/colanic/teichoic acid biosynthesis glycosyltransferase
MNVILSGIEPRGATYARIDTHIPPNVRYYLAKRAIDLALTLLLLVPLVLLTIILAGIIRLDSRGPALFRQRRVGKYGVEFELLKFRTMSVDSDECVHKAAARRFITGERLSERADNGALYKLDHDLRITRVGRVLRKTGLDELPQLWNVLRGDMSLVGPRPPIAYEVALYSQRDLLRLSGTPGITGRWQVYGRSRVAFGEMVEMDIAYLRTQSIVEDMKLIMLTIPVMVRQRGGA